MGRRGGRKSGIVRGTPPTLDELKAEGPRALKELLNAAYGQGDWSKLGQSDRLKALTAAIPYLLGRPTPMKEGKDEPKDPNDGMLRVGVRQN